MVVKPAIAWISKDTDLQLLNDTVVVLQMMGDNTDIYVTPVPTLSDVFVAKTNFSDALGACADGGPTATTNKNNKRQVLAGLLRQLASYVQVACLGDLMNLQLSGFPIQKPSRSPIGVLPAPQNLTVAPGPLTGQLVATANPVFGAATYNWTLTPATPGATVVTGQSTGASFTFAGLTPGVIYAIAVNAFGSSGASNWSGPVSQMAV
jgi:hypothetical protein